MARYWRLHGFAWDHLTLYSALSQGMEMLFLVAFTFGRHSAAALVHMAFQTACLSSWCLRPALRHPARGNLRCPVVYASPVAGITGISAYNDLAVATLLFAGFYLLQVWDELRSDNLLILSGLLIRIRMRSRSRLRPAFLWGGLRRLDLRPATRPALAAHTSLSLAALLMAAPWVLRNWLWLGNPAAPFLNAWFPNPYFYPGAERDYLAGWRITRGHAPLEYPDSTHGHGRARAGMVGPVFLLAPLALLALRHSARAASAGGRRALRHPGISEYRAALPHPGAAFRGSGHGLAVSSGAACCPRWRFFDWCCAGRRCCRNIAARMHGACGRFRPRGAAHGARGGIHPAPYPRIRSEDPHRSLRAAPMRRIFSFAGRPSAYWDREIVVGYESALGIWAQDTLLSAVEHPPAIRQRFRFRSRERAGRPRGPNRFGRRNWTVSEMRVFQGAGNCRASPEWRLSAWPNGWDVQFAFDNNYATRWSTWQPMPRARLRGRRFRPAETDR